MSTVNVRMPKYPECWESRELRRRRRFHPGTAGQGRRPWNDDNILHLETGKVALDIPTPTPAPSSEVHVIEGDVVAEGALLSPWSATRPDTTRFKPILCRFCLAVLQHDFGPSSRPI